MLGIPTFEDKVAQRAVTMVLEARKSCLTSCCTQCHFDIEPFLGVTARAVFSASSFAFRVSVMRRPRGSGEITV